MITAYEGNRQPGSTSATAFARLAAIVRSGEQSREPVDVAAYDRVFHQLSQDVGGLRERIATERERAPRQWDTLQKHPQGWRLLRIRNDGRFHTWGLYRCLVERSRGLAGSDPRAAAESAELALAVAKCLAPAEYGEALLADFQAAALAALAEAKRQRNDLAAAWKDFEAAQDCLQEGTGDPLERAELELLRERLLRDAGREKEADWTLKRAKNLFRRIGDPRLEPGSSVDGEPPRQARQARR